MDKEQILVSITTNSDHQMEAQLTTPNHWVLPAVSPSPEKLPLTTILNNQFLKLEDVIRNHLVKVVHYHAALIRTRMHSSEERIHLLSARLMFLERWNITHQHCILLWPSHQRSMECISQQENSLVSFPKRIVRDDGNPIHSDEKCPYFGTFGLLITIAQYVRIVCRLLFDLLLDHYSKIVNNYRISLQKTLLTMQLEQEFMNLTGTLPMPKLSKSEYV